MDIYGKVRNFAGRSLNECPFRWQGQYFDEEVNLCYNRFQYYDPDSGNYISQDPIGLAGNNPTLYGYVKDVNSWVDVFGLKIIKGQGLVSGRSKKLRFQQLFNDINNGVAVGKPYKNTDGQLPNAVNYMEYDYNTPPTSEQRANGADRGKRRVVVGDDGKAYYTNDHFENFQEIKKTKCH